jgi:hypothetical protein
MVRVEDGVLGSPKTGIPCELVRASWRSTRMVRKSNEIRSRVSPRISPRLIPVPAPRVTNSRYRGIIASLIACTMSVLIGTSDDLAGRRGSLMSTHGVAGRTRSFTAARNMIARIR